MLAGVDPDPCAPVRPRDRDAVGRKVVVIGVAGGLPASSATTVAYSGAGPVRIAVGTTVRYGR
jgi:hypothetical protein